MSPYCSKVNFCMIQIISWRARKQHEDEAAEIARIQKKIFQLVQKEEPFDIFISYKELEEGSSQRTVYSVIAQDIYSRLTQEGYKVFFQG